ncbi:unnamed protein product [Rotaria sp. Silwood2]|nr:unnamed protein product [Rotaria sp. Silwood2]CAF4520532.1 unnamed protein product [Rotaria sp. Silwood2]
MFMSKSNSSSQRSSSGSYYQSSQHLSSHAYRSSYAKHYPTFHVHSSDYELVFINNNTSTHTINKLLNHVGTCKQYAIDTESERTNNQLSLIQINSIPIEAPSRVMLFELKHLPNQHSQKYDKILQLFQLIFRLDNEIYSWGDMQRELEPAKDLIIWPIPATLNNIQPHFPAWYNWARTQCRVQSLSHRNDTNDDNEIIQQHQQQLLCHCHPPSPYQINELWSLQNAFRYGCNLFLDKSCTLSHWSSSLSSSHSSLSHADQKKMIHYATHDVMAVTFLIRPITEKWTFDKIKNRKMNEMFVAFDSIKLPPLPTSKNKKIKNINMQKFATLFRCNDPDAEEISSDDEIYLNQLIKQNDLKNEQNNKKNDDDDEIMLEQDQIEPIDDNYIPVNNNLLNDNELIVNNHYMVDDVNDKEETAPTKKHTKHQQRSIQARHRRNQRRNKALKRKRYYYSIKRKWYPRFTMLIIRKILRLYNIDYTHVRTDGDKLLIGLKNQQSEKTAEHQLPSNIFNRQSYLHYRKLFR